MNLNAAYLAFRMVFAFAIAFSSLYVQTGICASHNDPLDAHAEAKT